MTVAITSANPIEDNSPSAFQVLCSPGGAM
jgi:hypothetical protein